MKNSFAFFKNDGCQAFPCHKVADAQNFNCLFCFCPLYHMEDCGGNFSLTPNGVKDCTNCTLPHRPENYDYIIEKLKKA